MENVNDLKDMFEQTENVEVKKETSAYAPVHDNNSIIGKDLQPVDIDTILPRKIETKDPNAINLEDELFGALDRAVEKEKKSITERVDAITEMQHKEFLEMKEKEELQEEEERDNHELYGIPSDKYNPNVEKSTIVMEESEEDLDEEEQEIVSDNKVVFTIKPAEHITVNTEIDSKKKDNDIEEEIPDEWEDILDEVDDEDDINDDEKQDFTDDEVVEILKEETRKRITPIKKSFDLSKFSIAKKGISAQRAMKTTVRSNQSVADWILYNQSKPISVTGLSGSEILKMNMENSNRNRINALKDSYRIIYDHVVDANKAEFEIWLKQIPFADLPHLYFALYMATFNGSNFINNSCPHCNQPFIQDMDFSDMVKYEDDEVKEKVNKILRHDTTNNQDDTYPVELFQASDSYVFGLTTPSIWSVLFETASLTDRFLEKYADLIDVASCIDSIYYIDENNERLIPIDTKPVANDQTKTAARRIRAFYDIIKNLNSVEYYALRKHILDLNKDVDDISYCIPACTCPKCGKEVIENNNITPDQMLFTRHQLAAIANM